METNKNRVLTGIVVGLLTTAVLASIGVGAYRAGQRSDQTIQVVESTVGDGDAARTIVVDGPWRDGPDPGFFFFPLVVIGVIAFFAIRRGRGGHRGPGGWRGQWEGELDEWHRRAHTTGVTGTPSVDPPQPPSASSSLPT